MNGIKKNTRYTMLTIKINMHKHALLLNYPNRKKYISLHYYYR